MLLNFIGSIGEIVWIVMMVQTMFIQSEKFTEFLKRHKKLTTMISLFCVIGMVKFNISLWRSH